MINEQEFIEAVMAGLPGDWTQVTIGSHGHLQWTRNDNLQIWFRVSHSGKSVHIFGGNNLVRNELMFARFTTPIEKTIFRLAAAIPMIEQRVRNVTAYKQQFASSSSLLDSLAGQLEQELSIAVQRNIPYGYWLFRHGPLQVRTYTDPKQPVEIVLSLPIENAWAIILANVDMLREVGLIGPPELI